MANEIEMNKTMNTTEGMDGVNWNEKMFKPKVKATQQT